MRAEEGRPAAAGAGVKRNLVELAGQHFGHVQHLGLAVTLAAQAAFDIEQAAQVAASLVEMSPNLREKVPPKPQQVSASLISLISTWPILPRSWRGCCLMPSSRRPEQESW